MVSDPGKEVIKEIVDEKPKLWNNSQITQEAKARTDKSKRTIQGYLRYYREHPEEGVLNKKIGRESFYYSAKYKEELAEKIVLDSNDLITIYDFYYGIISNKKEELAVGFDVWLKHKIKTYVYFSHVDTFFGLRYVLPKKTAKKFPKERYQNRGWEDLDNEYNIERQYEILLGVFLSHPDDEIKKQAWKYFDYYKEKKEEEHHKINS